MADATTIRDWESGEVALDLSHANLISSGVFGSIERLISLLE
jgi:hypothetical protein